MQTLLTGKEPLDLEDGEKTATDLIPEKLQDLIANMMSPDAKKRPDGMFEVACALGELQKECFPSSRKHKQVQQAAPIMPSSFSSLVYLCLLDPYLVYGNGAGIN